MAKVTAEYGKEELSFDLNDEAFAHVLPAFCADYGAQYGWQPRVLRPDPAGKEGQLIEIENPETPFQFWLRVLKAWSVEVVLEHANAELVAQKQRELNAGQAKLREREFEL